MGDPVSILRSGRSSAKGNGSPLQYSYLENSMDGGAWWATVHGVAKSQMQLSDFTLNFSYIHSPVAQMVVSSCNSGEPGLIPGLERFPGEENGYALQYSCMQFHGQRRLTGYSPWDFRVND